jgi:hypothetical protein
MLYKPIENCHMENAILGEDFNFGAIGSFFRAFICQQMKNEHKKSKNVSKS